MHDILLLLSILERGLLFSLVATGVYITSRIIKFDDLTTEGSFGMGGAITAVLLGSGWHDGIALLAAVICGALCGALTGILHTRLHMNKLMSGIITTTGLFSLMLVVAGPHATIHATPLHTLLTHAPGSFFLLCAITALSVHSMLTWLQRTEYGLTMRAVGLNESMVTLLGKRPDCYKLMALCMGNALSALTGALFAWHAGYYSAWSSVGILITALASLMIGEALALRATCAAIMGSIMYQLLISLTFELNVAPEWNRLITALLIVALIAGKQVLSRTKENS